MKSVGEEDQTVELEDLLGNSVDAAHSGPPLAICPGLVLRDRFRLESQIASGGTSLVFRARDLEQREADPEGRRVAIKVLRDELRGDARSLLRLKMQFACMQALSHPGILNVFDLDRDGDIWFITMELADGEPLADYIRRSAGGSPQILERKRSIVAAIANALAHAHSRGVLHGDLKPGNVVLTQDGGVRLLDFANRAGAQAVEGEALTPAYASPQRLARQAATQDDDAYSLGCLIYELFTGKRAIGPKSTTGAGPRQARPEYSSLFSDPQWEAVSCALQHEVKDRTGALAAIGQAFARHVVADEPVRAKSIRASLRGVSTRVQAWLTPARRRAGWIGATAVAGLVFAAIVLMRMPSPPQAPPVAAAPVRPAPPPPVIAAPIEPVPAIKEPPPPRAPAVKLARLGFGAPNLEVSRHNVSAALLLRRVGNTSDTLRVVWKIVPGSAQVNRDFMGPLQGRAVLHDGQRETAIYIPLGPDGGAVPGAEFTVQIMTVTGPAKIGEHKAITVSIVG